VMLPGRSIQDFRSCLPSRFYQIMIFGVSVHLVVCTVTLELAADGTCGGGCFRIAVLCSSSRSICFIVCCNRLRRRFDLFTIREWLLLTCRTRPVHSHPPSTSRNSQRFKDTSSTMLVFVVVIVCELYCGWTLPPTLLFRRSMPLLECRLATSASTTDVI